MPVSADGDAHDEHTFMHPRAELAAEKIAKDIPEHVRTFAPLTRRSGPVRVARWHAKW